MLAPLQVILPFAVLTLVAGGSLLFWALLFIKATHEEAGPSQNPRKRGPDLLEEPLEERWHRQVELFRQARALEQLTPGQKHHLDGIAKDLSNKMESSSPRPWSLSA